MLQSAPSGPDLVPCYLQAGTPRTLPQLAKVTIGLFTAEASFRTASDHCNALFLRQAGVKVDHVRLADVGVRTGIRGLTPISLALTESGV